MLIDGEFVNIVTVGLASKIQHVAPNPLQRILAEIR